MLLLKCCLEPVLLCRLGGLLHLFAVAGVAVIACMDRLGAVLQAKCALAVVVEQQHVSYWRS
jgi:hypothetical protein